MSWDVGKHSSSCRELQNARSVTFVCTNLSQLTNCLSSRQTRFSPVQHKHPAIHHFDFWYKLHEYTPDTVLFSRVTPLFPILVTLIHVKLYMRKPSDTNVLLAVPIFDVWKLINFVYFSSWTFLCLAVRTISKFIAYLLRQTFDHSFGTTLLVRPFRICLFILQWKKEKQLGNSVFIICFACVCSGPSQGRRFFIIRQPLFSRHLKYIFASIVTEKTSRNLCTEKGQIN